MLKPIIVIKDLTKQQIAIIKQTENKLIANYRKCALDFAGLCKALRTNYLRFHIIK